MIEIFIKKYICNYDVVIDDFNALIDFELDFYEETGEFPDTFFWRGDA